MPQQQQVNPMRVLLVEDEPTMANVLSRALESKGYAVTVATTLSAALQAIDAGHDRVVLDLLLPDGNGLDVLERVRSRDLPALVAVVTASYNQEWLRRAASLRADAVFLKPFDLHELLDWLAKP